MRTLVPRYETALVLLLVLALAGCGGGGGAPAGSTAGVLPAPASTQRPAVEQGPVAYMQSSGPLSSSGTIVQGAHQAFVAVMSHDAAAPSTFAADTLSVSATGLQSSSRARSAASRAVRPRHVTPVEAFPADDRALSVRLRANAVQGRSGASPAARVRQSAFSSGLTVGAQASIWVQQGALGGSRTNVRVPATLAAQTDHGNIWIDDSIGGGLTADVAQIAADFENAYASDVAHFASADYSSNAPGLQPQYSSCSSTGAKQGTTQAYIAEPADRRINVMVVSSQNLGGLGGYFSGANYMPQAALNCLKGGYESNEAPFIFVGWFANNGATYELKEDLVRSTAHELQHLINFVNHAILAPGASSPSFDGNETPFLNEGLSMLAQDFAVSRMYGAQGVQFDADDALERANAYLSAPANFSVSGFSGIDSAAWGGDGSPQYNCGGGCYGAAYLFQRYLRDRFGGDAYAHAMETSGVVGTANLQRVTGEAAGDLLDDFALAMGADTLGVAPADPRFSFGSLHLTQAYRDQFGGSTALGGVYATPAGGASTVVRAPVGGFAYVSVPAVPAGGMPVRVTDSASVAGFALTGGLAQH